MMHNRIMRTTITLDPDVATLVEREMQARNLRFKEAVNEALRRQLGGGAGAPPLRLPARDLGPARIDITHANRLVGQLEDAEIGHKLEQGR